MHTAIPNFEWLPATRGLYMERLHALPPAAQRAGMFLLGEAYDSYGADDAPRYLVHAEVGDTYFRGSRPIELAEFDRLVVPIVVPDSAHVRRLIEQGATSDAIAEARRAEATHYGPGNVVHDGPGDRCIDCAHLNCP